jgi:hypothetical protein
MPEIHIKDSHTSLPRSRSHNGPTNPRNKPQLKATRKHNSRSEGLRQSMVPRADHPHGPRGLSAGPGRLSTGLLRTVRNSLLSHQYCTSKNGLSVPYPRTVHMAKTDHTHLAGCSTNLEQPKALDKTGRKEATQELAKNTTNTWLAGSSCTVHEHRGTVLQTRTEQPELENENATSPVHPRISQTA